MDIPGTPYEIDPSLSDRLDELGRRVSDMRASGRLSPEVLGRLRRFFKIKNIYNSNAIEGNVLNVGETRLVVEQGMTLTGRPLKDQAEAKNLSAAVDFLETLASDNSRSVTESDIRQIHALVLAGMHEGAAGSYRNVPVEIGGSEYKPPGPEMVPAQMKEFGEWLARVSVPNQPLNGLSHPILTASAAHTWLVTIHPFIDGNGRVGRLILNLMLMRFGFPIAIITKADRSRYYDSLEISQTTDLTPFAVLVAECVEESLEEYEGAAQEQREHKEWAQSIVGKLQGAEIRRASNQYEVWRNAMELLKSVFRQTAEVVDASAGFAAIWFKDFGQLELEKYLALRSHASAKKTWFFRLDFKAGAKTARYLFFFGSPSYDLRRDFDVTLHISREEPPGSFNYERLDLLTAPNVPSLIEIGYDAAREEFAVRRKASSIARMKIEQLCRNFFEEIADKHFQN